jgi:hypothetical protein
VTNPSNSEETIYTQHNAHVIVDSRQPFPLLYYTGVAPFWSLNHMDAIRYARDEDALRTIIGLPNGWHLIGRAEEHSWISWTSNNDK